MMLRFESRPARRVRSIRSVAPRLPGAAPLIDGARVAIVTARAALLARQSPCGAWRSGAGIDAGLTARLVLLDLRVGASDPLRTEQLCRALRGAQSESGGWPAAGDGPVDLSCSVLAYFALKSAGASPADPDLRRARQAIAELGGLGGVDLDAQRWLAMFGQVAQSGVTPVVTLSPKQGVAELIGAGDATTSAVARPIDPLAEALWEAAVNNRPADLAGRLHHDTQAETLAVHAPCDQTLNTAAALGGLLATGADPLDGAIVAGRTALGASAADGSILARAAALLALADAGRAADAPPWLRVAQEEEVAAGTAAAADELRAALAESLRAEQQADGSWCSAGSADALTTAVAVRALASAGVHPQNAQACGAGRKYLAVQQQLSGGWDSSTLGPVPATAAVLLALAGDGAEHTVAIEAAANWLLAHQHASGAWCKDDTAATAAAVEAVVEAGMELDALEPSVAWLLDASADDGGWSGTDDAFCPQATAAALTALVAWRDAASRQLATAPRPALRLVRA
ncbi:Squalene--hopene cyclase [Pirellulimonas nuda]|uniref:Squalene--hopene cyclase n=1 Tax=Pirellulimonas nuda TaxID=2528009 RepID=A0A518DAI6_9BACT|nr:prenyltransferase/squalene oxidase repeat-containing protein [Pirellulimonas nuda]QDU88463.1 Squalene--hopene cyclase [Pirellulimonas nuda]